MQISKSKTDLDSEISSHLDANERLKGILADNMSSKIISLYETGMSLRDISSHIEEVLPERAMRTSVYKKSRDFSLLISLLFNFLKLSSNTS